MVKITEYNLSKYRAFLEKMWLEAHEGWDKQNIPSPLSTHMCRYTCLFLKAVLDTDHAIKSEIITGCPLEENSNAGPDGLYGFLDKNGNWHDHSWLLVEDVIIDLTADQFGDKQIIITDLHDKRYNPSGDQSIFIPQYLTLSQRTMRWLELHNNHYLFSKTPVRRKYNGNNILTQPTCRS